jgi:hypothetical protein
MSGRTSQKLLACALNQAVLSADNSEMGQWFTNLLGRFRKQKTDTRGLVRAALQQALRNRCKVYLEAPQGVVAATQVQQVSLDELIISQPSIGGLTYPLAFGETLKISFVDQTTNLTGRTKCLGRVKVNAGSFTDGKIGTLYAYRMGMPESLKSEERRHEQRAEIIPEIAPDAQLYAGSITRPVLGKLTSISMGGACIHTDMPINSLSLGQEIYLKSTLAEPVGILDEVVEVNRLEPDRRTGMNVVGVTFRRRLDRLDTRKRTPTDRLAMPAQQQRKTA